VRREYDCTGRRVRLPSEIDFSGPMVAGTAVSSSDTPGHCEADHVGGIDEAYLRVAFGTV